MKTKIAITLLLGFGLGITFPIHLPLHPTPTCPSCKYSLTDLEGNK